MRFRPLHGYWDSPEFSSAFLWRGFPRRASPRRYTGYSFVTAIITLYRANVNSYRPFKPPRTARRLLFLCSFSPRGLTLFPPGAKMEGQAGCKCGAKGAEPIH
jgi:hypothetical protein